MSASPRKRTNSRRVGMSALCQKRTHALQQTPCTGCNELVDYLVGATKERDRDLKTERLRGLQVNDQLDLGGPFVSSPKILCTLLQHRENAPLIRQGCASFAPDSADRTHCIECPGRRAASPVRSNLSFRCTQLSKHAERTESYAPLRRGFSLQTEFRFGRKAARSTLNRRPADSDPFS